MDVYVPVLCYETTEACYTPAIISSPWPPPAAVIMHTFADIANPNMKKILSAFLFLFAAQTAFATLKLPALIADQMVLQRHTQVNLWGKASPGDKVTALCSWDGSKYDAGVVEDGRWLMKVNTPGAGGPYTITFTTARGGDKTTVQNVYIGEVWICSGQSNMVHPVRGYAKQPVDTSAETIAEASKYSDIHMFRLTLAAKESPQEDCEGVWQPSSPESVAGIAATAYFFARSLYQRLHIPIGIIQTAWGSARAEGFMSPGAVAEAGGVNVEKLSQEKQVQKRPYLAYNGMIYPLRHYTARGFTWFQLPANRHDVKNYAVLLTTLVKSWRALWGDDSMPFINVQDPMFPWDGSKDKTTLPMIVEQQFAVRGVIPNYWIATSTDTGDENEPHHPQKPVNGERMALLALQHVYGMKGLHADAPDFEKVDFRGGKATVTFSNAEGGMVCKGDRVLAFELAGADQKFYPAEAKIAGSKVEVQCAEVPAPVALRYAFHNYREVSLYNKFGQTPRVFRTDSW